MTGRVDLRRLAPGTADHAEVCDAIAAIENAADAWLVEHGDGNDRRLMLVAAAIFFAGGQCGLVTASALLGDDELARMLGSVRENFAAGLQAARMVMPGTPSGQVH